MDNIVKIRDEMCTVFTQLKNQEIDRHVAKELANVAGKVIGTLKVQLEYRKQVGQKTQIPFMEDNSNVS